MEIHTHGTRLALRRNGDGILICLEWETIGDSNFIFFSRELVAEDFGEFVNELAGAAEDFTGKACRVNQLSNTFC